MKRLRQKGLIIKTWYKQIALSVMLWLLKVMLRITVADYLKRRQWILELVHEPFFIEKEGRENMRNDQKICVYRRSSDHQWVDYNTMNEKQIVVNAVEYLYMRYFDRELDF